MGTEQLPINTIDSSAPVGRIIFIDHLEALATKGMEFVLSPILVSQHGKGEPYLIGFTLRALGAEPASVTRAAMIAPNHPVNREE